ncbi:S8 family peptidase [Vreelandella venusta]|uniref:S8 family peptidase n=1 Tax=Vreelandella venusta TaxID=44935 RepID=UPI004043CAEE
MARNLRHFHLRNLSEPKPYRFKGGGAPSRASDVPDRAAHAQAILKAIDSLPLLHSKDQAGLYIEVLGRPNEKLKTDSLNKSDLKLLKYVRGDRESGGIDQATVFANKKGLEKLRDKVEKFEVENNPDKIKGGVVIPGRPRNADLVQSIATITEAGLLALWRSPARQFPPGESLVSWEVWLEPSLANNFIQNASSYNVHISSERLHFPEDTVVVAHSTKKALALAIKKNEGVKALATPSITAEFFDNMDAEEQTEWVEELKSRLVLSAPAKSTGYIALLDTGVSLAHPLIQPVMSAQDRHVANLSWGYDDMRGHGTQMASLAVYGDLAPLLDHNNPINISHRLESVKIIPDAGYNYHHLLGAVTRNAVDAVEKNANRRRVFTMASTTSDDTPHDGAPTSWSSEIDQLTFGVSGAKNNKRLMLISAGNSENKRFASNENYLKICDHEDNEIESPSQSWNAICVGAFTQKINLPLGDKVTPVAPFGDLSPSSRTASWASHWPLKPDVVLEGGNWAASEIPPPLTHSSLSLLSAHYRFPQRSFTCSFDTSAATALASKEITELWTDYPDLWPETIRGLYISSARWTNAMKRHLPKKPKKSDYALLFQRYGYGVPDIERARRSASNALTLIVEDTITPYGLSKRKGDIHNEMRLFELPWPVEALRALGNENVTLRVTLSTFIAPNPSEAARGSKYCYASHNLRFKLNRADENSSQFMSRISKTSSEDEYPESSEEDMWTFGNTRRDVGSLHIDQLTCKASDLARRNLIAVHPVSGWWKSPSFLKKGLPNVRYSLIVEIDAEKVATEIYSEVDVKVKALAKVNSKVAVMT